ASDPPTRSPRHCRALRRRTPTAAPRRPSRCRRRARRRLPCRPPRSLPGTARAWSRAPPRGDPVRLRPRLGGARSAERALQLLEERLVVAIRVLVAARLELLEQAALLVVQPARHRDVHEHPLVAAAEALQHGHALTAQHLDLARLRARRQLEL